VIRVRNIVKNGGDSYNENLGIEDRKKYLENRKKLEMECTLAISRLKPPGFLKSNFKNKTVEKFKCVNGKYFGIKC